MTWKRVATAVVLIPFVVGLVLFAPTGWVAAALGVVTILAMIEYFSLGDAIGHRAYRVWTIVCALLIVYAQWAIVQMALRPFSDNWRHELRYFVHTIDFVQVIFFVFLLGITVLTLATKRPMVEALPAAGISSSALLLIAFPLSFAVRLHGWGPKGPELLLFALVITWAGDTVAYFVGRAIG